MPSLIYVPYYKCKFLENDTLKLKVIEVILIDLKFCLPLLILDCNMVLLQYDLYFCNDFYLYKHGSSPQCIGSNFRRNFSTGAVKGVTRPNTQ